MRRYRRRQPHEVVIPVVAVIVGVALAAAFAAFPASIPGLGLAHDIALVRQYLHSPNFRRHLNDR